MSNIQVTNIKNLSGNNTVAISSAGGDLIIKNDLIAENAVEISGIITANSSGLLVSGASTITDLVVNDTVAINSDLVIIENNAISIGSSISIQKSGIISAASFVGDGSDITGIVGSNITGIVTGIQAGNDITILESPTGNFIITSTPTISGLSTNLNLNSNDITGTGNINISGIVSATSFNGDGSNLSGVLSQLILTGENGITISQSGVAYTFSSNFASLADDITPQLGGDLDLNSNDITGTGNISINGDISASSFTGIVTAPTKITVGNDITLTGTTGIVSATQFIGDGSGLTGVVGSGSGVVIQDEGSSVGTAATINFTGDGVTASLSNGVASVTITDVGISNVSEDLLPQLGGNLNINSKYITGTGGVNITGVVTATTFDGALKGLPQNTQTSGYTLVASDAGKNVAITTGGVTLNTGVFDVGDTVSIYNDSEYTQMISVGAGVTMRRVSVGDLGDRGLNQYGLATIMCIRNDEFVISGAGLT